MAGAEVGDPDLACTVVEARVPKCMREGAAGVDIGLTDLAPARVPIR